LLSRIYIEISNICNLQCSFCPKVLSDKKVMGLVEFEEIIKQVVPIAKEVCLHLMGEPLAHPNFLEILDLCEKYHAKIQLTTNGILLKKYEERLLQSSCLRQINFSLQAFQDNFPNKKIENYLLPILSFAKSANEKKPDLYINLRLWNHDGSSVNNEDIYACIEKQLSLVINKNIEVGAIKSKRIWNRLYLHFDSRFTWPSFDNEFQGSKGKCHGVIDHIGIHADGSVSPCCLDKDAIINLGNCLEDELSNILSSKRVVVMRDGLRNGILVEKLCQHCTYINRFSK